MAQGWATFEGSGGDGGRAAGWLLLGLVSVAGLTALAVPGRAVAAACGGEVACGCGDVVVGEVAVLEADLGPCAGDGLRLRGDARVDCRGHAIVGAIGSRHGVLVDSTAGGTVENCVVSGFSRGIRIRGGSEVVVRDVETFANEQYGIELAGGTRDARIERASVHHNGDEGIHVGSGADGARLLDVDVHDNQREEIYVLSADDLVVDGGRFSTAGGAAFYIKHSSGGRYRGASVNGGIVQLRGDSHDNRFEDVTLAGGGFVLQALLEKLPGWTFPHDNRVEGGSIRGAATCFRFEGAYDNEAHEVAAHGCVATISRPAGGRAATGNLVELIAAD